MSLYLGENLISGVATPIEPTRNIGQIIQSTIPLSDAGLHLLDGALISGSGSYAGFVTYISGLVSTYPDLFETEANWQTSVTNYGVCGKFVYDSVNNTVRLPKITGFIEGTTDVTALGDLVEAGLPNIIGNWQGIAGGSYSASGAVSSSSTTSQGWGNSSGSNYFNFTLNASNYNSIYGNANTVQPQSIKVLYYIVIATSTKTDIEVDIDEIATDLNGKADIDLSNCTKPHIVETYVNGTSWYRVYSDGWCEQGGVSGTESTTRGQTINIVFVKNFINTDYTVIAIDGNTSKSTYSTSVGITSVLNGTKTVSGVSISSYGFASGDVHGVINWKTCGYIS